MEIACFFAQGFEEVEALTTLNILKRANCSVRMIGVTEKEVTSSQNVTVKMDMLLADWYGNADCFILPGGMPGSTNLANSKELEEIIRKNFNENKLICAICAAPVVVLDKWGILKGKKATSYPSLQKNFKDAECMRIASVVEDGNVITSQGVGTVFPFAFAILERLMGEDKVDEIKKQICY